MFSHVCVLYDANSSLSTLFAYFELLSKRRKCGNMKEDSVHVVFHFLVLIFQKITEVYGLLFFKIRGFSKGGSKGSAKFSNQC